MNNLSITNVSKTYSNGVKALKNVSLEIPAGMFGLLGPNGAGKSSLMRTIATLQEPDGGSIKLGELDVLTQKKEVRKMLGYLPQEFGVYPKISAEVLLDHLAVLKGLTNGAERREVVKVLLHKTNLYEVRKKNLGGYSGGMKRRFGIAQALLANPKLIIVDEPTAGLDPAERNRFHNVLCEVGENAIVILSTHIVEDVKELCTRMAIINKGEVLLTGSPQEAIKEVQGKIYRKTINKNSLDAYKKEHEVISERLLQGKPVIHIYSESDPGQGFEAVEAELSDVYFSRVFGSR
ncbi:ABC transporter ATP-binding protein [Fulvivirga ulvae]|uniref:ABC transporter ATP-binding protein n=1 Tax=Fulvivirga ulvae TaxID=2904245 RepID=UPI001F169CE5|nr:ABC transporter ATP-binding protein [Fulvivirga ulvae]UII31081.1 ABC transporter ATP-binding protein [Fulvivirga ulvae]